MPIKKTSRRFDVEIEKFKPPPPVVTVNKLVSKEVLADLGVADVDLVDFMTALRFVTLQTERKTTAEIVELLGIERHLLYEPRWKQLITSARRLVLSQMMLTEVGGASAIVMGAWSDIVQKQVSIALQSRFDRDSTAAAEFLAEYFIVNAEKPVDASAEQKYLQSRPSFAPVQINNITNNVTIVSDKKPYGDDEDEDIIDITAAEMQSPTLSETTPEPGD